MNSCTNYELTEECFPDRAEGWCSHKERKFISFFSLLFPLHSVCILTVAKKPRRAGPAQLMQVMVPMF